MNLNYKLHLGDCLVTLRGMADNSADSIVTDPPYGLSFMGKKWDYDVPGVDVWAECLRVLKPGGHLLAFAGTRTQHRMAVRIEDAGFEIRDMIAWVYGSGFPKSLDVGKAVDKLGGVHPDWNPDLYTDAVKASGRTHTEIDQHLGLKSSSCYWARSDHRRATPLHKHWVEVRELLGLDDSFAKVSEAAEREVVGHRDRGFAPGINAVYGDYSGDTRITAPATEAAQQWQGWGTALKPALEPITVARKPLNGTVAANVMQFGTGALNIDGCRVALNGDYKCKANGRPSQTGLGDNYDPDAANQPDTVGRWPANLIHDGSDEVLAGFPAKAGASAPVKGTETSMASLGNVTGERARVPGAFHADTGSAARFFYCAKASKRDRDEGLEHIEAVHRPNGNKWTDQDYRVINGERSEGREAGPRKNVHPTVKPTDLMAYLVRLVTPPGGIVLDPFMGSGSTGKAAMREGMRFIGCEMSPEYMAIADARIAHELALMQAAAVPVPQFDLFAQ